MKNSPVFHRTALLLALSLMVMPGSAQERSGAYLGLDLGVFFPNDINTMGSNTDVKQTRCDGFLFKEYRNANQDACTEVGVNWGNRFNMDAGVLSGLNVGYLMDNFRFELEYLYRSGGGDTSPLGGVESRGTREFLVAEQSLDDFESHHLLANVYYDFLNGSKFTPYAGFGIGWAKTEVDYTGVFIRNTASEFAKDLELRNIEAAAGTVSKAKDELSDDGFGYQFLVGVDYWLTDHLLLGFKARYAEFDSLGDRRREWDLLRSHDSAVAPGGDRVTYEIDSNDLRFWGMSLNLKYQF